jgi:hypothetical protein
MLLGLGVGGPDGRGDAKSEISVPLLSVFRYRKDCRMAKMSQGHEEHADLRTGQKHNLCQAHNEYATCAFASGDSQERDCRVVVGCKIRRVTGSLELCNQGDQAETIVSLDTHSYS